LPLVVRQIRAGIPPGRLRFKTGQQSTVSQPRSFRRGVILSKGGKPAKPG
jgi:hypothetical protein